VKACRINPLTPDLNPSTQRCLPRYFAGDFIFKGVTARRLYNSFGVKGLRVSWWGELILYFFHPRFCVKEPAFRRSLWSKQKNIYVTKSPSVCDLVQQLNILKDFHEIRYTSYLQKVLDQGLNFLKVSSLTVVRYIWACMIFYHYFPYFLNELDEICYRNSPHNASDHLWVVWKSVQWKPCFTEGFELNFSCIFCSFRPIWIKFITECVHKNVLNYWDLVKISFVKAMLYLIPYMNCFPHVLSTSGEIRYNTSAHNAVKHMWV
jgi:hypothetical protein